ncbi:hypothetical protein BDV97DRAFT_292070 [Delphinella strobiligena]|nr:hypothetical protein BDV97DRAFT_292070 [Delphinella strobiligena]
MTTNGHEPFQSNHSGQSSNDGTCTASIPDSLPSACCCGQIDCAFLRHTNAAFEALEANLRTAGSLGQALLVRHEAYVAEAEKEKARMAEEIQQLTTDKKALEAKNASTIDENRSLLDQLECVNNAVSDSDVHIQSLTATLQSTQAELHKLNNLASRTDRLERELEQYEREQASLQAALASKTEGEKAMTMRWQEAERRLAAFEDQLETIERDAKQERERHVEMVGRMERQRVVEQELETASGRLRGAAAAKTMARDKHGSTVVSHFVKDILQDNANLQLGIVELREMLTTSNDEVERLRDQLAQFCPQDQLADYNDPDANRLSTLSLGQEMSRASAQELHVHHHYHAPSDTSSRRQSQTLRRPKKKPHHNSSTLARFAHDDDTPSTSTTTDFQHCSHRRMSHESLISISGMDIHTLKSRPSQLLTGHSARSFSSQPVVCPTMAHAARPTPIPRAANKTKTKAGGWIFGRWGSTPTPTLTISTPLADMKVPKIREAVSTNGLSLPSKISRTPGINQTGPICGFGPEPRLPPDPVMTKLDEEALRESLSEA